GGDRGSPGAPAPPNGPLLPLRVGYADHRRLDHIGMPHQLVLELDGRDPFPARLDDVLGPIGDLDEPVLVDATDVAGAQPTMVELVGCRIAVVAAGDPRTPHLDLPHGRAVPLQRGPGVVDDAQLDATEHATRLLAPVHLLLASGLDATRRARQRRERARLGHAPALDDVHAVVLFEALHQRTRHG